MPFICMDHQAGYEEWRQFNGHWANRHKGEQRPDQESAFVPEDQVPEGVKIAARPPEKPHVSRAREQTRAGGGEPSSSPSPPAAAPPPPAASGPDEDQDDASRLDSLLVAIGAEQKAREAIITGYRHFSAVRDHPANLFSFISTHLPAKLKGLIPMLMGEMFPHVQPEEEAPYIYPGGAPMASGPGLAPYWPVHPPSHPPRYGNPYRDYRALNGGEPEVKEPDPELVAMKAEFQEVRDALLEERRERQEERRAQEERDRQAALDGRFSEMEGNQVDLSEKIEEVVQLIRTEQQEATASVKASETQQLAEEVKGLRDQLEGERQIRLEELLKEIRDDKGRLEGDVAQLRTQISEGATGRTPEDLVVQLGPLLKDAVDTAGDRLIGELRGIRENAADGKLPTLVGPKQPGQDTRGSPIDTAQQIGQRVALEDRIITGAAKTR